MITLINGEKILQKLQTQFYGQNNELATGKEFPQSDKKHVGKPHEYLTYSSE